MLTISKAFTVTVAALSAVAFAAPTTSRAESTSVAQALDAITSSVQSYVSQLSMSLPLA